MELIGGIATSPEDQDTLEELMTMSEGEVSFWQRKGVSETYMVKDRFQEDKKIVI